MSITSQAPADATKGPAQGDRTRRAPWLLGVEDPFRRTSAVYLAMIGFLGGYLFVFILFDDQPARLRAAGATTLVLLGLLWIMLHRDDRNPVWLTPFEAAGLLTVGLAVGDVLRILGLYYVALYFRAIREGMVRALVTAVWYALSYFALLTLLAPAPAFSVTDLSVNLTIAFPMVGATMSLLGARLRKSRRHQDELSSARDQARVNLRRLAEAERVAGVGSWDWNAETDVASFSEGFHALVGGQPFEPTFGGWLALVHPEDRATVRESARRVAEEGSEMVTIEYRAPHPNGELRVLFSRARGLFDEKGELVGAMGTVQDITHLRALGSELARQQELSEMKSRFLSTVSHELRTPLTSLVGFTEAMLADDYDRATRLEFLGLMRDQSSELQALIEDLITFGRVEAGELTFDTQTVNLAAELEKVVSGLTSRGSVSVDVDEALLIRGDPLRIRQIVRNLLDNALKYGEAPISVHALVRDFYVVCCVTDSGAGVDSQHVEVIFEPYRRLVDDRTMGLPGVGLGLPLSRILAERQGGSLRYVENGAGPTFELALPAA